MAAIHSIKIEFEGDTSKLKRAANDAERTLRTSTGRMRRSFEKVNRSTEKLRRSISRMRRPIAIGATAIAGATAALFAMQKRAIQAADALQKNAERVGLSVEAFQELKFAAELTGVKVEGFTTIMQRLGRKIGDADRGNKQVIESFKALGVEVRDASTGALKPLEQVIEEVADGVKNLGTDSQQLSAVIRLLDTEGGAFVNTLRGGGEGLRKMREEAT